MEFLSEGTLITLEDGSSKAIEELKVGDEVQTYEMGDEDFDMAHIEVNPRSIGVIDEVVVGDIEDNISEISFNNDSSLIVTNNYPIYGADEGEGWISVDGVEMDPDSDDERIGIYGKLDVKSEAFLHSEIGSDAALSGFSSLEDGVFVESIEAVEKSIKMYSIILENGQSIFANNILVSTGE
ncbi:MAG: hypothetical protein H8E03_00700 [Pelagibacteraceae bacterium]|nr:hypothetical protein [Pelagibacteraceae bacterium]